MADSRGGASKVENSLFNLALEEDARELAVITETVLLGKILSSRPFRRFTVREIVSKNWRTKEKVNTEKVAENIFKLSFMLKEDKDFIFQHRPWTINGAHLVLKEWHQDCQVHDISFNSSTFTIQVHGLPPRLLNERNARAIGSTLGVLLNPEGRLVVAQRFLRLRVDITVTDPLPVGFAHAKDEAEELWIQFRYEKLADVCFKCGMLNHVTGQCSKTEFEMIHLKQGLQARKYGSWLNADRNAVVPFTCKPLPAITHRRQQAEQRDDGEEVTANSRQLVIRSEECGKRGRVDKDFSEGREGEPTFFQTQAADFELTFKRQLAKEGDTIQKILIKNPEKLNLTGAQIASWAESCYSWRTLQGKMIISWVKP